jgi:hypothetical protein
MRNDESSEDAGGGPADRRRLPKHNARRCERQRERQTTGGDAMPEHSKYYSSNRDDANEEGQVEIFPVNDHPVNTCRPCLKELNHLQQRVKNVRESLYNCRIQ